MNALKLTSRLRGQVESAVREAVGETSGSTRWAQGAYRTHIVPVYEGIAALLRGTGKRLMVHYDGKVRLIADDIAKARPGHRSLTPPPEG